MDAVHRLLAIEAIRGLKARYFRCMDTKDWSGLSEVFAPDAVFDLREMNSVRDHASGVWTPPYADDNALHRGHDAVLAMIRGSLSRLLSIHHGHMGEIEITGETTARAIWAMEDRIHNPPGDPPFSLHGAGHYHDTYVLLAEGWAIETTRITRLRLVRDPPA